MKRILMTLALVMVSAMLCAWPDYTEVQRPGSAMLGYDLASNTWRPIAVSGDGKMVSDAEFSAAVPDANGTAVVSSTASAQNVASIADRESITVVNTSATETLWISFDASAASAAVGLSIPVYPYGSKGVKLNSAKVLSVVSATAVTAIVYQDGF